MPVIRRSTWRSALSLMFTLSLALSGVVLPLGNAFAKTFSLSITGDDGAGFIGSCLAKRGEDHEVLALNGKVPFEQQIDADFVSCRINATGRIVIDATSDAGQQQHAETKNGMVTLSLH